MTLTPIASIRGIAPGTVLAGVRGIVKVVVERYADVAVNPDGLKRPWSVQTIILEDKAGAEVAVEIINKDAVPADSVGRGMCLLSTESENKRLFGVKVDAKEGVNILRLTAKGEMTWVEAEVKQPEPIESLKHSPPSVSTLGAASLQSALSATEGGAKEQSAPVAAPIPKSDDAKITALVLLYDKCLMAVATRVGANLPKDFVHLNSPEGVHFATRTVFEAMLKAQ